MTDSSSDNGEIEVIADMAGELIHTRMELAKRDTQMTHVMRVGTFHMEIVPDSGNIDVEKLFNKMIDKLMKKYGNKLLEINIQQVKSDTDTPDVRHYG